MRNKMNKDRLEVSQFNTNLNLKSTIGSIYIAIKKLISESVFVRRQ